MKGLGTPFRNKIIFKKSKQNSKNQCQNAECKQKP